MCGRGLRGSGRCKLWNAVSFFAVGVLVVYLPPTSCSGIGPMSMWLCVSAAPATFRSALPYLRLGNQTLSEHEGQKGGGAGGMLIPSQESFLGQRAMLQDFKNSAYTLLSFSVSGLRS